MSDPLFSIIVPTWNGNLKTIQKHLDSIVAQTYKNIEYVAVDDSTNEVIEMIRSYEDKIRLKFIPLVKIERNLKRPMGFEQSEWEIVYFPDADMYLEPNLVEEAVRMLQNDATLGWLFIPEENIVEKGFWTKVKAYERSFYAANDPSAAAARIFWREAYKKSGGFHPELIAAEDWDLTENVLKSGAKLWCTQAKVFHDEWEVILSSLLKKKAYYGEKMTDYARVNSLRWLASRIYFFRGAFYRGWRKYFKHPILAVGMWTMLTLELFVGTWGMLRRILFSKK